MTNTRGCDEANFIKKSESEVPVPNFRGLNVYALATRADSPGYIQVPRAGSPAQLLFGYVKNALKKLTFCRTFAFLNNDLGLFKGIAREFFTDMI